MAEETKYIPYGQDEISQSELQTALANDLPNFMNRYKWLQKPKNRDTFLKIYSDMVNGLTGASNDSGLWSINTSNDMNSYLMSPREKEIAEHAAYYIQQQMAKMTPRSKAEEAKKEDLTPFKFQESFGKQLLNLYGGDPKIFGDSEQGWNSLDARGANGLRGTEKRKKKMAEQLELYRQELANGKDYNFEGTSFKDKQDALTKLQAAIDALRNTPNDESDDLPAFSALGLNYRNFFSNGGNEELILEDGRKTTYQEYNQAQKKKLADEAKAKAELAKQQRANQYDGYKYYDFSKFNGRPLTAQESSVEYLNNLIAKDKWTGDEASQIVQAFKLAEKNGQLVPITDKNELSKFSSMWKNRTRQLRKINGIEGIYYDTVGKKFVKPYKNGQTPQTSFQDVLNQNTPEAIAKRKEEKQNTPISKEGWTSADTADVISMVGDLVSLGGFWANIGGTATSLTSDLYADISRGKDLGDILKGVGVNLGWGIAGMLPGAKSTKLVARAARLVPKAFMLAQSAGIVMDPEVQKSAMKFTTTEGLKTVSSKDLENLKYLFHAVTGGTNIAKSHFRAKNYREQINKQKVQTKEGSKNLSNKDIAEINKAGRKGGQKAAESKFKEKTGQEAAEGQFKFSENGRSRFNPIRYSSNLNKFFGTDQQLKGQQTTDLRAISQILQKDRELPWYNWNKGYATFELTPFRSNPPIKQEKTKQNTSNQQSSQAQSTTQSKWSKIEKGPKKWSQSTEAKEYREMLKGNYSNNVIQGGTHKIGDMTFDVEVPRPGATNGFVEVTFKNGNKETIRFDTQKQLQERISKIIKDSRVQTTTSGKTKVDAKEMGKILKSLKARGLLKHGGKVEPSLDKIIEDFIKNNNI